MWSRTPFVGFMVALGSQGFKCASAYLESFCGSSHFRTVGVFAIQELLHLFDAAVVASRSTPAEDRENSSHL